MKIINKKMTVIIGIIDKKFNKILLGGDCAESYGETIFRRKDPKVFRVGEFIIGGTSSFRMLQLLRFSLVPPKIKKNRDLFEYMCTDFVNSVRQVFSNGGYLQTESDGTESGGTFLIGYKDKLFKIEPDFQVTENIDGIDAIGCGAEFALGSLYTSSGSARERLVKALEVSEYLSLGVSGPHTIIETE